MSNDFPLSPESFCGLKQLKMPDIYENESLAIAWNVFAVLLVIGLSYRVIMYLKGLKEEVKIKI